MKSKINIQKSPRTKTAKRKGSSAPCPGSPASDNRLMNAVTGLMDIVEGVQNIRWQFEGRRLVDTPQWCDLYCAWCAEKRKQENSVITNQVAKATNANDLDIDT